MIENLIGFERLVKLCLDNNYIEEITNLSHLTSLRWLDLSFNKIRKIQGLDQLTQLEDPASASDAGAPHSLTETLNLLLQEVAALDRAVAESDGDPGRRELWRRRAAALSADAFAQRRAVERLIRPLKGVVGISDNIRLKTAAAPVNLSSRIQDALVRQAVREARRIEVAMEGSVVTLKGHVHSWAERSAAEGATWAAPGVSKVNNQLTVQA